MITAKTRLKEGYSQKDVEFNYRVFKAQGKNDREARALALAQRDKMRIKKNTPKEIIDATE